jgi:trk system potassium uptake protein TrkH
MRELLRSDWAHRVWALSTALLWLCAAGAVIGVVGLVGVPFSGQLHQELVRWLERLPWLYLGQELLRLALVARPVRYVRNHWAELLVAAMVLVGVLFEDAVVRLLLPLLGREELARDVTVGMLQLLMLGGILVRAVRHHALVWRLELHPTALLLLSFAVLIVFGTALLLLPNSTHRGITLVDALFTAVSAVCVTGLTVVDISAEFTPLGQAVVLLLIQLGGLGLMTFVSFFGLFFSGGLGVRERIALGELFTVESLSGIRQLLLGAVALTLAIEAFGATLLYLSDSGSGVWRAVFHAVSAFCNAGFSLYPRNLEAQQGNGFYLAVIMALIVLGGLGFPVLSGILRLRPWAPPTVRLQHRLSVSVRIVVVTTAILLGGGTLLLWLLERTAGLSALPTAQQWLQALFLSVTARTAGFNTIPTEQISAAGSVVLIVLMWIGASPASTGGGVKTLTVAVALAGVVQLLRGRGRVELFWREIPLESVLKAFMALLVSGILLLSATLLLLWLEPGVPLLDALFEVTSAHSTVGLSRGITAHLRPESKLLLCAVMLIGRVGVLSVAMLLLPARPAQHYRYPQERIIIT